MSYKSGMKYSRTKSSVEYGRMIRSVSRQKAHTERWKKSSYFFFSWLSWLSCLFFISLLLQNLFKRDFLQGIPPTAKYVVGMPFHLGRKWVTYPPLPGETNLSRMYSHNGRTCTLHHRWNRSRSALMRVHISGIHHCCIVSFRAYETTTGIQQSQVWHRLQCKIVESIPFAWRNK